jgi:hypothetical protein
MKTTDDQIKSFVASIDPFDDFGFQIRPHFHWIPESPKAEIDRLEINLEIYKQYLLNGSRFPEHINKARLDEFNRLESLRRRIA